MQQQQAWVTQSPSAPAARVIDGNDIVYAGFVRRWAALFLDSLILLIPTVILVVLVTTFRILSRDSGEQTNQAIGSSIFFLVSIVLPALYFPLLESSKHQATWGKRALGIKVTDNLGARLSVTRALWRWFAKALSYLTLYIGFLMAGFTDRKRALHDMVAGTLVVDKWAYTEFPERQQRSASGCLIAIVIAMCSLFLVIPILAAISIPAYQDYVIRSQVSEGTSLADGSKTAVAEYYDNFRKLPSDNPSAGVAEPSSISGNYVSSVTITNGTIAVAYDGPKANSALSGKVLALAPVLQQNGISWNCTSAAGTTIAAKYLPTACR